MIYIYDILLNFNDLDKTYDFFEWTQNDDIEHIKRIGLIKVSPKVFEDFYYHQVKVGEVILKKILQLTEVFQKNKIARIEYACLFTDGNRVIAIEFNHDGEAICKSKLLLDEEEDITNLSIKQSFTELDYEVISEKAEKKFFTRKEEFVKHYLTKEIISTYKENDFLKLKFIYEEYSDIQLDNYKEMYQYLLKSMDTTLDYKHIKLYELLKMSQKRKQI